MANKQMKNTCWKTRICKGKSERYATAQSLVGENNFDA